MFDQVLDNFRKAIESTMQVQQEMFKNWTQQWTQTPMLSGNQAANWADQLRAFQKQLTSSVTDMLTKHRETLDTQYRTGIRMLEDATRLGEAKDLAQFRRLVEELWRQTFDCLKTLTEGQQRAFQTAAEKWFEVASKGAGAANKP